MFFILMEIVPLYTRNVVDWQDIPGSVFGLVIGTFFGLRVQRHMEVRSTKARRSA